MPVTKLLGANTLDAMKSEEGNDSLDTFIRQAVGKEPLFSFSRTGDSPVQWIQLLHALDQQDLPGWPLLAPMKIQLQKCDKCAREFCSPINYRRHMRVHRRSMNFPKEPHKYRDLLGEFWDKLSNDETKEIMSFKDVNLEEVPGSSIVRNIAANLRKPIFLSLPQLYVKAGSALVDLVQGRPSRLPISSQELFSILDDASERTFLCAGTAESLQKYVFDGEAGKIGLEMKNLIACTSFLVEQKLVKAWVADKDAEAMRCQKLLVEEEEAAQRRQAELLEKKRQRKIRQKEQRARDNSDGMKVDLYTTSDMFESIPTPETSSPEVDSLTPDELYPVAPLETIHFSSNEEVINIEAQGGCSSGHSDFPAASDYNKTQSNGSRHFITRWQVPKSQRGHGNVVKWEQAHKHREQRVNGNKVWTKKPKSENDKKELVKSRVHDDSTNQTTNNCQLMIGSISVTVRNCSAQQQVNNSSEFEEKGNTEIKTKTVQSGGNNSAVKFWRPRYDSCGQLADRNNGQTLEEDAKSENVTTSNESHQRPCDLNENDSEDSNVQAEDGAKQERMPFSVDSAKAFLAQRWKEATSGEHVELVVSEAGGVEEHVDVGNSSAHHANAKPKFRRKPEKNIKTKYIPKQRSLY